MQSQKTRLGMQLLCGAASLGLMSGTAWAQQAPEEDAEQVQETVVVKGFRGSLLQSLAVKRNETAIVDAISAEDIADFPDLNLAEALQRIPGVQIDRDGGQGRSRWPRQPQSTV